MKIFFCHASEDKPAVEQVFQRVVSTFPEVEGWLDTYQVVAGDDLIEKIAEGIESADKFLVFLSERSIEKPWVKAELRKALMDEIKEVKPGFIVPVKIGQITKVPPFLEHKKYIDLENQTQPEWLSDIEAVIRGVPVGTGPTAEHNLRTWVEQATDEPTALGVVFQPQFWADEVGFRIETTAPIEKHKYQMLDRTLGPHTFQSIEQENVYAVRLPGTRLTKTERFALMMKFSDDTDLSIAIKKVEPWDGSGADKEGMAF